MKKYIQAGLSEYTGRSLSPWHMPGHKRKAVFGGIWDGCFGMDLTEVPGTDDYHHPEGVILASERAAAEVCGAEASRYLVGGSTAGILAGILALRSLWQGEGSPVFLIAGNVHRSVINGIRLAGGRPVSLEPLGDAYYGPLPAERVRQGIDEVMEGSQEEAAGRIAGCVITSPTYGGAISPIREIHEVLYKEGIPLLVDEAHGAHFPFMEELKPFGALAAGAEIVVQSLHKTLPALTQTGIIHIGRQDRDHEGAVGQGKNLSAFRPEILSRELFRQLSVLQSSSPSYLLLASAEQAVSWADDHRADFGEYLERIKAFREELAGELKWFSLKEFPVKQDPTRLFITLGRNEEEGDPVSPGEIAMWLEQEWGIVPELSGSRELIFISTVMDDEKDLSRLKDGLMAAELRFAGSRGRKRAGETILPAIGSPVAEDIYTYPPGIMILRRGEIFTRAAKARISEELAAGRRVYGI